MFAGISREPVVVAIPEKTVKERKFVHLRVLIAFAVPVQNGCKQMAELVTTLIRINGNNLGGVFVQMGSQQWPVAPKHPKFKF